MTIRKDQTIDIRSNTQKQNIEQHEPHIKPGVNCCVLEGTAVLAPPMASVVQVVLLYTTCTFMSKI